MQLVPFLRSVVFHGVQRISYCHLIYYVILYSMRYMGFVRTAALLLEQQRRKKEAAVNQTVPGSPTKVAEEADPTVCILSLRSIVYPG